MIDSSPSPPLGSREHVMVTVSPSVTTHVVCVLHVRGGGEVMATFITTPGDSEGRKTKEVAKLYEKEVQLHAQTRT